MIIINNNRCSPIAEAALFVYKLQETPTKYSDDIVVTMGELQ